MTNICDARADSPLSQRQEKLDRARVRFGRMLLRWRNRFGWSGKTLAQWAAACPETLPWKVSSSTWTGFELGRAHAPAPETFLAFEAMNAALASGNHGPITDRTLKDRVACAEPFVDEDGHPWRAGDFFDCFIGELAPPAWADAPDFDGERVGAEMREEFQQRCSDYGLGPVTCLVRLLTQLPPHATELHQEIEGVMTSELPFRSPETAAAVADALKALA